jgi:hypothetical protein
MGSSLERKYANPSSFAALKACFSAVFATVIGFFFYWGGQNEEEK